MKPTEKQLTELHRAVELDSSMSEKRRTHILAVEKMAIRLGELYAPEKLPILRAAALLHDLTKEYTAERHVEILRHAGYEPRDVELAAPKTLHAMSAAVLIPEMYPQFDDAEIISAVRWHTTGHIGMTLTEKLVFLADYIDESRKFEDCVELRSTFFDAEPEKMSTEARLAHLDSVLISGYKMTIAGLVSESSCINPDTVGAYNELILKGN